MTKPEHRKVKYTKRIIRESFFELLETKKVNQITVKELCELADINRGTFYSHYTDIYDFVEKLEDELIEKMKSVIKFERIGQNNQLEMFVEVFSYLKDNLDDYRLLLVNPNSSRILDEILAEVYGFFASVLKEKGASISTNMLDYSFALMSSGSTRVVLKWIENDFEESPEEIAKLINAFTNAGFAAIVGD